MKELLITKEFSWNCHCFLLPQPFPNGTANDRPVCTKLTGFEKIIADLTDTIKRAIGLIAWMEVDEVLPYYCEGLIHLYGLFNTSVLLWDSENKKLTIDQEPKNIESLKQWYIDTYKILANHYLNKQDATLFLEKFAVKKEKYYTSVDDNIDSFIQYYFSRYKEIGQELDETDKKENYINR